MINGNVYEALLTELGSGKKAAVVTILQRNFPGNPVLGNKYIFTEGGLAGEASLTPDAVVDKSLIKTSIASGNISLFDTENGQQVLIEPSYPESRLIILGGGHIAKPLAEFGARTGFLVTIVDDRPYFANAARFPEAKQVICESFDKCFSVLNLNQSAYVVIVTRGHRHDIDCLRQALMYNTRYLGMIGSKRRVQSVMELLLQEGYSKDRLASVNAPIGLDIGAVTPEEIALSIIAQVISFKRSAISPHNGSKTSKINFPEFDRLVIEELARDNHESKAIVTIISTKGSTPRKAGAKMLVFPDGRTVGSIGGGCSEGEVLLAAQDILKNSGCRLMHIDMTGYIAEDEGMVCGGTMEVLIEASIPQLP